MKGRGGEGGKERAWRGAKKKGDRDKETWEADEKEGKEWGRGREGRKYIWKRVKKWKGEARDVVKTAKMREEGKGED